MRGCFDPSCHEMRGCVDPSLPRGGSRGDIAWLVHARERER